MLFWAVYEDIFMDEELVLETVCYDQPNVYPTCIMSNSLGTMNEVIRKLFFYVHV